MLFASRVRESWHLVFVRASGLMSRQPNLMRTRRCGEKSKRRCVPGERHLFDANALLTSMRELDTRDEANGGDSGDDPVPTHFQISHHRTSNWSSALWTDGMANFR